MGEQKWRMRREAGKRKKIYSRATERGEMRNFEKRKMVGKNRKNIKGTNDQSVRSKE